MPMSEFFPIQMTQTSAFGFVVDHAAFWGVPIPGFAIEPQPATSPPLKPPAPKVPSQLKVVSAVTTVDKWNGSDFSVLATRMPPFFHALHHRTDFTAAPHDRFKRRKEPDDPKLGDDLPGKGREALVSLFDQKFSGEVGKPRKPHPITCPDPIHLTDFENEPLRVELMKKGYFSTENGEWNIGTLGLLGALWIVILQADKQNTPLDPDPKVGLGGGYRLWHYKPGHHGGNKSYYTWKIEQDNSFNNLKFEIAIGRDHSGEVGRTGVATLNMELKWTGSR